MKKDELLEFLSENCQGREQEASGQQLRTAIRVSESDLHKLVNRLRCEGEPIASDRGGYYLAVNGGEVYSTIMGLIKMRDGLNRAIGGLERSLIGFAGNGGEDHR